MDCQRLGHPGEKALRLPDWRSGDLDNGPEQPSGHELLINGRCTVAGEMMHLPNLGATMRTIAAQGKAAIYQGEFAQKLSVHVQRYGGWITPAYMAAHVSTWDEPIVGRSTVCVCTSARPTARDRRPSSRAIWRLASIWRG